MAEKSQASQTLGLELTPSGVKAAELGYKGGKPSITRLLKIYFNTTDHTHLNEEDRKLLNTQGNILIATSMGANETLVRPLDIKLQKEKDIDAVLPFQADPLLPYPCEEAILDKIVLSKTNDGGSLLTVLAVKKDHLQRHLAQWQESLIEPEIVSAVPAALAAFSQLTLLPENLAHFILHLGEEQTCCVFVKEGKLIASKASPLSIFSLKQAFQQDTKLEEPELTTEFDGLDWNRLNSEKLPSTDKKLKDFSIEIGKVIFSLMKQTKELVMPPLLPTGPGSTNEKLAPLLLKEYNGTLLSLSPSILEKFSEAELKNFAIPIGTAYTGLTLYKDQINFLQNEFAYAHPWKRLKYPLFIYYLLSLCLAIAFYFFGQAYIHNKENDLRSKYALLLASMHKTYPSMEKELTIKPPLDAEEDIHAGAPLEWLNLEDIKFRLGILEKELKAVPDLFSLEPNIPKVSDLLAWLSTHPNVVGKDSGKPLITFESISYNMIKRPELNKRGEKYQVKVELDFTSANPTAAREFHDALLAPNLFIDPKSEIKWTTQKGRYKAVFLLKDRTSYP